MAMVTSAANNDKFQASLTKVVGEKTGRKIDIEATWRTVSFTNYDDGVMYTTKAYTITCEKKESGKVIEALENLDLGREYPMAKCVSLTNQYKAKNFFCTAIEANNKYNGDN